MSTGVDRTKMSLYLKFENIFLENMCNTPKGNIKELKRNIKEKKEKRKCKKFMHERVNQGDGGFISSVHTALV